jgi:transcriptional regulator with XRE-family HTH domain
VDRKLVGERLRRLRREQGLTLEQLASRTSLSPSFLSQVERGVSQPSISSLTTVCNALGVEIPALLGNQNDRYAAAAPKVAEMVLVTRASEALAISLGQSDVVYDYLSGAFPGRVMEILLNRFPPNHVSEHRLHPREEFGYVLRGPLTIRIGDESFALEKGDSYHFPASVPHSYAVGEEGADVLIASTGRFLDWGQRQR